MHKIWGLCLVLVLGSSCVTVRVSKEDTRKVSTLALAAYVGELNLEDSEAPKTQLGSQLTTVTSAMSVLTGELQERRQSQATEVVKRLRTRLADVRMQLVEEEKVVADAEYDGLRGRVNNTFFITYGRQTVPGLLYPHNIMGLDLSERDALLESLKVDALAVLEVQYVIGKRTGFAVGDLGQVNVHPKAVLKFHVYAPGKKDAIWSDAWAEGRPSEQGLPNTLGFKDDSRETELLLEAVESGLDVLLRHYEEALKKT
jgi:hypothetical protein